MVKLCTFFSTCLLILPCGVGGAHAQNGVGELSAAAAQGTTVNSDLTTNSTTTTAKPVRATILHTGKLLGYMRYQFGEEQLPRCGKPDVINGLEEKGLTNGPSGKLPEEINSFLCKIAELKKAGVVLVGVGDNFAPFLLARYRSDPGAPGLITSAQEYKNRNKDLAERSPGEVTRFLQRNTYAGLPRAGKDFYSRIYQELSDDSVAAFLEAAGYDAVAPDKEDFYFGAYRLYKIGRRLEKLPGVRIVADNLVLQLQEVRIEEQTKKERRPLPKSRRNLTEENDDIKPKFSGLALPWIKSLTFEFKGGPDSVSAVKGNLCLAGDNPDQLSTDCTREPIQPKESWPAKEKSCQKEASLETCQVTFVRNDGTYNTAQSLVRGDYYFCIQGYTAPPGEPETAGGSGREKNSRPYCMRLPVAEAMFSQPYVLVPDDHGNLDHGTAIFGVVEKDMRSNIAQENAGWEVAQHEPCGAQTHVSCRVEIEVLPPEDALKQSLDRFRRDYPDFKGITLLLAQMSQSRAEELARHVAFPFSLESYRLAKLNDLPALPRAFDVVIARSDSAHATPNLFLQVRSPERNDKGSVERRPLAIVPRSIYDVETKELVSPLGVTEVERQPSYTSYCVSIPGDPDEISCDKALPVGTGFPVVAVAKRKGTPAPKQGRGSESSICKVYSKPDTKDAWGYLAQSLCAPREENQPLCLRSAKTKDNVGEFEDRFRRFTLCVMAEGMARRVDKTVKQSDIAMLQARDFYFGDRKDGSDLAAIGVTMQGVLDRILWKGDLLTTLTLTGKQIKSVLKQSDHYQAEESSATATVPDTRDRYTVQVGVLVDPQGTGGEPAYFTHLDDLTDDSLVKVATSEHMATGDTGYIEFSHPAVGKQITFNSAYADRISSLICNALKAKDPDPRDQKYGCDPQVNVQDYRLTAAEERKNENLNIYDNRPYKGNLARWADWRQGTFHDNRPYARDEQEKAVEDYPLTEIVVQKAGVGYKLSDPLVSFNALNKFAGIANTEVNQGLASNLDLDAKLRVLRRFSVHRLGIDIGEEFSTEFSRQYQENPNSAASTSWPRNNLVIGPLIQFRGGNKYRPHWLFVLRPVQWGTQIVDTTTLLSGANGTTASFTQIRSKSLAEKAGVRYEKDTDTYWELGYQYRYDYDTLFLVTLNPGTATEKPCPLGAELSLAGCAQTVVVNGTPKTNYKSFRQTGMYWDGQISFPLLPRITYQVDSHGDLFKDRGDTRSNSALTRFYAVGGNALKVKLFGNFSLKPRFYWTYYENQVLRDHLNRFATTVQFDYSFTRDSRVKLFDAGAYKSGGNAASD